MRKTKGVCVVSGPGTFSLIRSGVLVANLLARLLNKPLVGIESSKASNLELLASTLDSMRLPPNAYVAPVYDREPNITLPKTA
jgi:tRNA A37 threonylcarbamoyladenosine modification protein TsaB